MDDGREGSFDGAIFRGTGMRRTLAGMPIKIDQTLPDDEVYMNLNTIDKLELLGLKDIVQITGEMKCQEKY